MKSIFNSSYDREGDILTIYKSGENVKESIEVSDDLIIDINKENKLINLELIDAHKFLHSLNQKITKEMLIALNQVELEVKNYRNYWFITLKFNYKDITIQEKLPAFVNTDFKSPLIASIES